MKRRIKKNFLRLCVVVDLDPNYKYPFKNGDHVLLLGEIKHMPGHVAVATKDGRILWGYHSDNFRKLIKEEV